jgi:hypothetical protein
MRLGAAFHGAGIDPHIFDPIQVEGNAGVRQQGTPAKIRNRRIRRFEIHCITPSQVVRNAATLVMVG